jgi:hypothetical protein
VIATICGVVVLPIALVGIPKEIFFIGASALVSICFVAGTYTTVKEMREPIWSSNNRAEIIGITIACIYVVIFSMVLVLISV